MGEQADYRIDKYASGEWAVTTPPLKPLNRCSCINCQKEIACESGLMQHRKAKHGDKYSFSEIDLVWNQERYEK